MENKKARLHGFVRDSLANDADAFTADRDLVRIDDQLMTPLAPWLLPNFRRIIQVFNYRAKILINL